MAISRTDTTAMALRSGANPTFTHTTTSGSNLWLCVMVYAGADTVSAVTYNSVSMTQLGKYTYSGTETMYIYSLMNPSVGSNLTVAITSSSTNCRASAITYSGVSQGTLPDVTPVTGTTSGTSLTTSITTSKYNSMILGFGAWASQTISAGTGTTGVTISNSDGLGSFESNPLQTGATGSKSLQMSSTGTTSLYFLLIAVAPVMALTDNLVSYWKLDESSGNASDSVGSNTLTNTGTATYSSGKINNGVSLNGSSQYLTVADNTSLSITGALTISCWVKIASAPSSGVTHTLVSKYIGSAVGRSYILLYYNNSGTYEVRMNVSSNGAAETIVVGTKTLTVGTWYHVTAVYTPSTKMELFVDGVSLASNTTSIPSAIYDSTTALVLGAWDSGPSNFLNGMLDEVGIWSRALTAGEVSQLYNGSAGSQYSFTDVGIAYGGNDSSLFTNGSVSSVTLAHTTTGNDRLLLVDVEISADVVSGITYAGTAMTRVGSIQAPSDRYKVLYYLLNPAIGTNNIVASYSSAQAQTIVAGHNYTGVGSYGNSSTNTASSSTTFSTTLTPSASAWTAMVWRDTVGTAVTAGSGTVLRVSSEGLCDSNGLVSGSTTLNLSGSSRNWGGIMVSYLPVSTTTSSVKTVNGLAYASVKTKNGLAVASIKNWNNLA